MTRRLLRLALPLALITAIPSAATIVERILLARSADVMAAVAAHAVLLAAASLLFLLFAGPSVHAVLLLGPLLTEGRHSRAAACAQSTFRIAGAGGLVCLALTPFAANITAAVMSRELGCAEVAFVRLLLVAVALQLLLYSALAPTLARGQIWRAVRVVAAGAASQLVVFVVFLPELGLRSAALARVMGCTVSIALAVRALPAPIWFFTTLRNPPDRHVTRELLRRGSAVGLHSVASFVTVVYLLYASMARTGKAPLAASALALGTYGLLSALPFAAAQATAMLAARVVQDGHHAQAVRTAGHWLTFRLSLAVAVSLQAVGWILGFASGFGDVSPLAVAFIGASFHACLDGPIQSQVWALRADGRERQVSAVVVGAGGLFAVTLFLTVDAPVRWLFLGLFDTVLFIVFGRILSRKPLRSSALCRGQFAVPVADTRRV